MFFEKVPLREHESFLIRRSLDYKVEYPYHIHPEFELILINNASGTRFVGDHVQKFCDNDLVLLGSNLPHRWIFKETSSKASVLVLQFKIKIFENEVFQEQGFSKLSKMLAISSRGILFNNNQIHKKVLSEFYEIEKKDGIGRLAHFFKIFEILAETKYTVLSGISYDHMHLQHSGDRIDKAYEYIISHYEDNLSLESIADKFNLSKSGFHRFFKRHTGKNFSQFINELRVSKACQLLIESDESISNICFKTGFTNVSYFNRIFKHIYLQSPKEYRILYK